MTHLGDHSHGLVTKSDSFSVGSLHLDEHEVVDSTVAVVGDVLADIGVLETEEPQGNGTLRVVKLCVCGGGGVRECLECS